MPATQQRNPGKTEFVKEVLRRNPHANARKIREAWTDAGNEGSISQTLVNKQRSVMGLAGNIKGGRPRRSETEGVEKLPYTGKKRGRKPKSAVVNGQAATGGVRSSKLSEIEADIDRLLFRVMTMGGLEQIEEGLRRTRRLLYTATS